MLMDDAETTPLGVEKAVFRYAVCSIAVERISKTDDPPNEAGD